jgi:hypothetical protein
VVSLVPKARHNRLLFAMHFLNEARNVLVMALNRISSEVADSVPKSSAPENRQNKTKTLYGRKLDPESSLRNDGFSLGQ